MGGKSIELTSKDNIFQNQLGKGNEKWLEIEESKG